MPDHPTARRAAPFPGPALLGDRARGYPGEVIERGVLVPSAIAFLIIGSVLATAAVVALVRMRPIRQARSVNEFHRAMRALAPRGPDER